MLMLRSPPRHFDKFNATQARCNTPNGFYPRLLCLGATPCTLKTSVDNLPYQAIRHLLHYYLHGTYFHSATGNCLGEKEGSF
jgi:hypothetical protein